MTASPHEPRRSLRALLPEVPVPENFEEQLWLRRMLRELPAAPVPDTFEEELWRTIRRHGRRLWWKRLALVSLLLVLGGAAIGVWQLRKSPSISAPLRSVTQIEPLSVPADSRFLPSPSVPAPRRAQQPATPVRGGQQPLVPPED